MSLPPSAKADLLMLLVTLLAAISWMFSKEAVLLMPPLLFMGLRFLLAGLLLGLFAWRQLRRLGAEQYLRGARVGLVFGVAMCFWVSGLNVSGHIGEGAFLASLAVILVPVMARLVFGEKQPASTWLALPVAVAGLAMLSLQHGFRLEAGQFLFLLAAVIFALHYTLNTRAANARLVSSGDGGTRELARIPVMALTTISLACAGAVALLASLVLESWRATFADFSPVLAGWILASVLIGTSTRFALQTWAQSLSPLNHGVVILVLEPVWVAGISAVWFAETMSPSQAGGCALIFTALLINRWGTVSRLLKSWL